MPRAALVFGAAVSLGLGAADLAYLNLALVPAVLEPAPPPAMKLDVSASSAAARGVVPEAPSSSVARGEPSPVAILFATGSAALSPGAEEALEEVAQVLRDDEDLSTIVVGHADERGSPAFNDKLSRRRARRVVGYLVQSGVARRRLGARWFGESRPLAPGREAASLAKNRRVEITFLRGEP